MQNNCNIELGFKVKYCVDASRLLLVCASGWDAGTFYNRHQQLSHQKQHTQRMNKSKTQQDHLLVLADPVHETRVVEEGGHGLNQKEGGRGCQCIRKLRN
jgi:hypothetical protein